MIFKTNVKMKKMKIFHLQYNSNSNDFKKVYAVFLFVTLFCRDMQRNRTQNMIFQCTALFVVFFALINKNHNLLCNGEQNGPARTNESCQTYSYIQGKF